MSHKEYKQLYKLLGKFRHELRDGKGGDPNQDDPLAEDMMRAISDRMLEMHESEREAILMKRAFRT